MISAFAVSFSSFAAVSRGTPKSAGGLPAVFRFWNRRGEGHDLDVDGIEIGQEPVSDFSGGFEVDHVLGGE